MTADGCHRARNLPWLRRQGLVQLDIGMGQGRQSSAFSWPNLGQALRSWPEPVSAARTTATGAMCRPHTGLVSGANPPTHANEWAVHREPRLPVPPSNSREPGAHPLRHRARNGGPCLLRYGSHRNPPPTGTTGTARRTWQGPDNPNQRIIDHLFWRFRALGIG